MRANGANKPPGIPAPFRPLLPVAPPKIVRPAAFVTTGDANGRPEGRPPLLLTYSDLLRAHFALGTPVTAADARAEPDFVPRLDDA